MTEDEAKTRWCPFVRLVSGKIDERTGSSEHSNRQPTFNRVADATNGKWALPAGGGACCIGTKCMAWRDGAFDGTGIRTGYCGLAGKP